LPEKHDLIIIGAGPAGLAAGIYGARMGLRTLVIGETLGGMAVESPLIENYPGFTQISGFELVNRMREQAEKYGANVLVPEKAVEIDLKDREKAVITDRDAYTADALIIATGSTHRKLGVPGEEEFKGRGVSYCATCDGPLFKGRRVMVVGGGNSAVVEALYLKGIAGKLYLAHRRDDLRADAILKKRILESDVEILWNSEVKAIEGDTLVRRVRIFNNKKKEERVVNVDGVFIRVGEAPQSGLARKAGIAVDKEGFIVVNRNQETSMEGVYAAGDVTGGVRQIGVAVGAGITAAVNAYLYVSGLQPK
jgi:thioredoxin reductase (NADPH)